MENNYTKFARMLKNADCTEDYCILLQDIEHVLECDLESQNKSRLLDIMKGYILSLLPNNPNAQERSKAIFDRYITNKVDSFEKMLCITLYPYNNINTQSEQLKFLSCTNEVLEYTRSYCYNFFSLSNYTPLLYTYDFSSITIDQTTNEESIKKQHTWLYLFTLEQRMLMYCQTAQFTRAEACLKELANITQHNMTYQLFNIELLFQQKNYKATKQAIVKIYADNDTIPQKTQASLDNLLCISHIYLYEWTNAITLLPDNFKPYEVNQITFKHYHDFIAISLMHSNKQYALDLLQSKIYFQNTIADQYIKAVALDINSMLEEALQAYDTTIYSLQYEFYHTNDQEDEAFLKTILSLIFTLKGIAHTKLADTNNSAIDFEKALLYDPDNILALCNQLPLLLQQNNINQALAVAKKAYKIGHKNMLSFCFVTVDTRTSPMTDEAINNAQAIDKIMKFELDSIWSLMQKFRQNNITILQKKIFLEAIQNCLESINNEICYSSAYMSLKDIKIHDDFIKNTIMLYACNTDKTNLRYLDAIDIFDDDSAFNVSYNDDDDDSDNTSNKLKFSELYDNDY